MYLLFFLFVSLVLLLFVLSSLCSVLSHVCVCVHIFVVVICVVGDVVVYYGVVEYDVVRLLAVLR